MKVSQFTELRKRLNQAGAEVHVVKNSIFRIAAKEAGVSDFNGSLAGQVAVVTGGAKGIGRGCARVMGRAGACIAVVDFDEAACEASVSGIVVASSV